jgi:ribonuclease HIII
MNESKTYSISVEINKKDLIYNFLDSRGFAFKDHQYSFFKAQHNKVTVIFYTKGKLVIQGLDSTKCYKNLISEGLIPDDLYCTDKKGIKNKDIESSVSKVNIFDNSQDISASSLFVGIGIDESGKGDFFGPLVVSACFVDEKIAAVLKEYNIQDSKKLSPANIKGFSKVIRAVCPYETIEIGPEKYNDLYKKFRNLNNLLAWAHSAAAENLIIKLEDAGIKCKAAISDQFAKKEVIESFLKPRTRKISFLQFHKAERVLCVAAASIIAREHFVRKTQAISKTYSVDLPLGCSSAVKYAAHEIIKLKGINELRKISKEHFKTYSEIINEINQ